MHVLQLVPCLDVGGVERGVVDLARGLLGRGHRVSVVSSGGALVPELCRLGAAHYTLPVDRKAPHAMWQVVPAVAQLIQAAQVDVVHARSRVPAWTGYLAARRTQRPFVTTCHGFYRAHPASRVMTWGRLIIVPSEALGRYLIDRFQVPPDRLRVIPRGVDVSQFRFRTPAPHGNQPWRIGIIGRLSALKGHEVAIRALALLRQQRQDVRLCVIGDAPAGKPQVRARLQRVAESLGVGDWIEWCGTRHDIPEALASLDLVVVPSTYPESFGRSVIEAQAIGVPVVASRLGALPEIIEDNVTGVLVPPADPVALAQAVRRLISAEDLRARMIERARQRVEERFTLERMVEATTAVYQECLTKPRVVVWKVSALGDIVLATPSLRAIRRHFRDARISLVVGRPFFEAVARCPYVDEVVVYDPQDSIVQRVSQRWRLIRRLQRLGADLSVDLQNSRWTHAAAWLSGIPVRIGYRRRWGRLLNRPVSLPARPMAPVAHQQRLLEAAGIAPDGETLELWPSERDEQEVERLLRRLGADARTPLIGIHPGGSGKWKTKRWDPERWAALCDALTGRGYQVVVTGSVAEQPLGELLARLARTRPLLAIGQTRLMELACLIRRCRAFVTHDSAPLHIAAAVGTPTLALFGPTDPARHLPPSPHVRSIHKKLFCSPCYSSWCRTITHACMKQISVEEVVQHVEELMRIADCRLPIAESALSNPKSEIQNPKSS